ncbi:MAG: SpoIID/LytB domain-containing protein [bacterium]|nr:SpoIID/LytB domain-containing protein [bacterium]
MRDPRGRVIASGDGRRWVPLGAGPGTLPGNAAADTSWVEVVPTTSALIEVSRRTEHEWSPTRRYAGTLRLIPDGAGAVRVINVVDVESYVAGVLPTEIYANFHTEAFRAQAIVTRTYCLYLMSTRAQAGYDLTAGEGAQVYGGMADTAAHRQAVAAARDTRGLVCTWSSPTGERVFCTYFSSACGGGTQSAGRDDPQHDVPPLAGGVRCDYCRIAKGEAYRWSSRSVSAQEAMERIARRYSEAKKLGGLRSVNLTRESAGGHIQEVRLEGTTGRSLTLRGENFRLAVGGRLMRSANCDVRFDGKSVVFENGKGFGHGMGLCQWGMEGQARQGRTAAEILRFYYPESHISRAY